MVTGGSGLVGSGIRMYVEQSDARPEEEWVYLSSSDGDLRDRKATEAIFEKYKPTHVIHLAAKVGGLFANMSQKVWNLLKKNVNLTEFIVTPPPWSSMHGILQIPMPVHSCTHSLPFSPLESALEPYTCLLYCSITN